MASYRTRTRLQSQMCDMKRALNIFNPESVFIPIELIFAWHLCTAALVKCRKLEADRELPVLENIVLTLTLLGCRRDDVHEHRSVRVPRRLL